MGVPCTRKEIVLAGVSLSGSRAATIVERRGRPTIWDYSDNLT